MRRTLLALALLILTGPALAVAQTGAASTSAEPFKLGTFEIDGEPRIGLVLRDDTLIVDLHAANRALERDPAYPRLPMPETMRELIGRYEYGMKYRLYEIVASIEGIGTLTLPVVAGPEPTPGTGAYLPPVSSYRKPGQ